MTTHTIQQIPLKQLIQTKDNPRRLVKDAAFKELVESIRANGVLVPAIVRPIEDYYDLRAGARRLAAAIVLDLETLPCIVRELDDKAAMEVTLVENVVRDNFRPIEEARGIESMKAVGWTVEEIADRFGKTPAWVARRARLSQLAKPWLDAIDSDDHPAARWSASALEIIARLPTETQEAAFAEMHWDGNGADNPRPADIQRMTAERYLGTLGGAPFDLKDESLSPKAGSCTACPKRSAAEPLLFDADEFAQGKGKKRIADDKCLDRGCYDEKSNAHCERRVAELAMKYGRALPVIHGWESSAVAEKARSRFPALAQTGHDGMGECEKKDEGAIPGIIVAGSRRGETVWVHNITKLAKVSKKKAAGDTAAEQETSLEEKREKLDLRRKAHVLKAYADWLPTAAGKGELDYEFAEVIVLCIGSARHNAHRGYDAGPDEDAGSVYGHRGASKSSWHYFDTWSKRRGDDVSKQLLIHAIPHLQSRLIVNTLDDVGSAWDELECQSEVLGTPEKLKALIAAAAEEIPEQKS